MLRPLGGQGGALWRGLRELHTGQSLGAQQGAGVWGVKDGGGEMALSGVLQSEKLQ